MKKEENRDDNVFAGIGAPARRALENAGIKTLKDLAKKTEAEILKLHGMGPSSLPRLKSSLKSKGLSFRK